MKNVIEFGREVYREVQKVTWPTQRETSVTTVLIVVMAVVAAIFFFFVDWGVSRIITLILGMR